MSFVYYEDGKPLYRCVNEFSAGAFTASEETPNAGSVKTRFIRIGPYGTGYLISINAV